ncbi:hypothetical protein T492DRAFT_842948 [Pavlovales sp. CCMP2436]|nr:hypothetical protein T492DRAFT_842948 [Pavlovales sp. CCMP2436]
MFSPTKAWAQTRGIRTFDGRLSRVPRNAQPQPASPPIPPPPPPPPPPLPPTPPLLPPSEMLQLAVGVDQFPPPLGWAEIAQHPWCSGGLLCSTELGSLKAPSESKFPGVPA